MSNESVPGGKANTLDSLRDIETRLLRDKRESLELEEIQRLLEEGLGDYVVTALAEGGYKQLSPEQNRDLARGVLEKGSVKAGLQRNTHTFDEAFQIVRMAKLEPAAAVAALTDLEAALPKESKE